MIRKILVADDESDLLEMTLLRLKKTGYDAFGAEDGREVQELARQLLPDLIILDIYLPYIEGDEIAKIFKKDEKLKNIPIILISATTQSLEKKARECGADGFFLKPFDPADLIAMIRKFVPEGA